MEASILITLYLKELGVKNVAVKAVSDDHEKLLRKIGADTVFIPERYAARQLAHKLVKPGLIEFLPMDSDAAIQEVAVDAWGGKTLRELDLTNNFRVQVIARKSAQEESYSYIPRADDPLQKGDKLILVGREDRLVELKS
jgi:trk system potassium uptake protein